MEFPKFWVATTAKKTEINNDSSLPWLLYLYWNIFLFVKFLTNCFIVTAFIAAHDIWILNLNNNDRTIFFSYKSEFILMMFSVIVGEKFVLCCQLQNRVSEIACQFISIWTATYVDNYIYVISIYCQLYFSGRIEHIFGHKTTKLRCCEAITNEKKIQ